MNETSTTSGSKHSRKTSSIFFYIITFALFIVGIRYFGNIGNDIKLFKQVKPIWLITALMAQIGTYFFNAITYQVLLQKHEHNNNLSLKELFEASVVMLFLNQTIPSVGVSGGTFLLKLLHKKGVSTEGSIFIVLADLFIHYISMILFAILLIILTPFFHFPHNYIIILIIGIVIYLILGIVVTVGSNRKIQTFISSKISHIGLTRRLLQKYKSSVGIEFNGERRLIETLALDKTATLHAIVYDIGVVVCDIFTIYTLFLGLGISTNFIAITTGYILIQIITLLPILPGSLLVYEGGMSFFFSQLGLPLETSITVTLLYRCLSFWIPIPLGYILYRKLYKVNDEPI